MTTQSVIRLAAGNKTGVSKSHQEVVLNIKNRVGRSQVMKVDLPRRRENNRKSLNNKVKNWSQET